MDRQRDHREHIGRQVEQPLRDLDPCTDARTAEGSIDLQLRPSPISAKFGDAEHEPIDLDVGERFHGGEGDVVVGGVKVEVRREPTRRSGPELPQRRAALEHESCVKQADGVKARERMVLRYVEQRWTSAPLRPWWWRARRPSVTLTASRR